MYQNILFIVLFAGIIAGLSYVDGSLDKQAELHKQRVQLIYSASQLPN